MGKAYWYGKEIEGRLYGIDSLYIARDFKEYEEVSKDFNHVLIGVSLIDEMKKGKTTITWDLIEKQIDEEGKMFSIEAKPYQVKDLPHAMKLKCHILLWVDVPELDELKSSDSVKLSIKDHDMYVYTLFNGQRVTRNDYWVTDRYDK